MRTKWERKEWPPIVSLGSFHAPIYSTSLCGPPWTTVLGTPGGLSGRGLGWGGEASFRAGRPGSEAVEAAEMCVSGVSCPELESPTLGDSRSLHLGMEALSRW